MEMDERNEQTEIEEHLLVDIKDDEQDTQQPIRVLVRDMEHHQPALSAYVGSHQKKKSARIDYCIQKNPRDRNEGTYVPRPVPLPPFQHATQKLKRAMEDKLQSVSSISKDTCIYRVPKNLQHVNEDAYVPRLVSLGPFHHGNKGLEAMEEHKWRYFKSFIEHNNIDLDDLLRLMKTLEETTRGFYGECIALCSDHFVEVMLVDAIFVINFLLGFHPSCSITPVRSIYDEAFFGCQVFRDMMLLENQLPMFILEEILKFAKSTNGTTITELARRLLECHMIKEGMTDLNSSNNARHLVDFLRLFYMPVEARLEPKYDGELERIKSASKLHKAGVRFEVASGKSLLDIKFKAGVLEIPHIVVCDWTETVFRNVLAYDQCHRGSSHIADYFVLMGMLIDTADDVQLLVENKILQNDLATEQEVSKVFNDLEKEVIYGASFYLFRLLQTNQYLLRKTLAQVDGDAETGLLGHSLEGHSSHCCIHSSRAYYNTNSVSVASLRKLLPLSNCVCMAAICRYSIVWPNFASPNATVLSSD